MARPKKTVKKVMYSQFLDPNLLERVKKLSPDNASRFVEESIRKSVEEKENSKN